MPEIVNLHESGLRRSPRIAAKQTILATVFYLGTLLVGTTPSIKLGASSAYTTAESAINYFEQVNENFDQTCNDILYHVHSVAKVSNESYTFKEMLQQDDRQQLVESMQKEINDHSKHEHWEVILRS